MQLAEEFQEQISKLSGSARYRSLMLRHRRVTYLLTGIAIFQYGFYFLVIAWARGLAGMACPAGSAVSVIIWLTVLIIILSVVISAGYIWWTWRYHDPDREEIMKDLGLRHE